MNAPAPSPPVKKLNLPATSTFRYASMLTVTAAGVWIHVLSAGCANPKPPPLDVTNTVGSSMGAAGPRAGGATGNAPAGREIRLTGAINDTVAFEYVVATGSTPVVGLTLAMEDLVSSSGTITPDTARMFRHWPVTIDQYPNWYLRSVGLREPRAFPDVLVPIDAPAHGQPFSLAARSKLVFWIEIRVPPHLAPGEYRGDLVTRDFDGRESRTTIVLNLADVFLSADDALAVPMRVQLGPLVAAHTSVDPSNPREMLASPESRKVIEASFRLLHEHGLDPFTTDIRPRFEQDIDGSLKLDWTLYDEVLGPAISGALYDDGRMPRWWPLPVDLTHPDASQFGGAESATYSAVLRAYLDACVQHFEENDWLDKAYVAFDFPRRANPRQEDLELVRRLAQLTDLVGPALAFHSRLIPQPMAPFGWFEHRHVEFDHLVDLWATPARYQHPATLRGLHALGRQTWLVPDRPPWSGSLAIEAAAVDARSLAWQAFLQGHHAIEVASSTDWPADVLREDTVPAGPRGDLPGTEAWLLYPGKMFGLAGPVPSVRLKRFEQGLRDYQRLNLLSRHGRGETARLIAGSLIKAAGTDAYGDNYQDGLFGRRVLDPQTWELARTVLDQELAAAVAGPSQDPAQQGDVGGAPREAWSRLLASTRGIQGWVEGMRLRLGRPVRRGVADGEQDAGQTRYAGLADARGYSLTFDVAVRSELRTPVEGELRFGALPLDAVVESDSVRAGPISEMGMERRRLTLGWPGFPPADLDGHFAQPIVFDAGPSGTIEFTAEASVVRAVPSPFAIAIDGRLDDWTPAAANAAGAFRRITAMREPGELPPPAKSRTVAYFCFDEANLYIGLHAGVESEPRGVVADAAPPLLRNTVRYEDLMPCDEDLVEVLIDPTNIATQSDELFHIVVKSTGNPRFERGVGVEPPIGRVQPWPGEPPACCVVKTEYGWSAELAIPFTAFGEGGVPRGVWGVNIARLEPNLGEYSDWARAPRYCYDPRTLGNLVWPE